MSCYDDHATPHRNSAYFSNAARAPSSSARGVPRSSHHHHYPSPSSGVPSKFATVRTNNTPVTASRGQPQTQARHSDPFSPQWSNHHHAAPVSSNHHQPSSLQPPHQHQFDQPLNKPRRSASSRGSHYQSPYAQQTRQAPPPPQHPQEQQQPMFSASPAPARQLKDKCGHVIEHIDEHTGQTVARYRCGALLGTGAFAKVYDFVDLATGEVFAAKVVEKTKIKNPKKLKKLMLEIDIHKRLQHKNIIRIFSSFQDDWHFFIILEKCSNATLLELSRSQVVLSVPEAQYIMLQLLCAVEYLHSVNVIHRDLKLANVMVDSKLNLKVGDFGLAAALTYDGEKKRTMCGTPNYIAPEILNSETNGGYCYKADTWSLGVILFTLFVGKPPFETDELKTTYSRIRHGIYHTPPHVPPPARRLIERLLQLNPERRPSLVEIRSDPFFDGCPPIDQPPLSLLQYYYGDMAAPPAAEERPLPKADDVAKKLFDSDQSPRPLDKLPPQEKQPAKAESVSPPPPPPTSAPAPAAPAPEAVFSAIANALKNPGCVRSPSRSGGSSWQPLFVTEFATFPKYGVAYRCNSRHFGACYNDRSKLVVEEDNKKAEYYTRVKVLDPNSVPIAADYQHRINLDLDVQNLPPSSPIEGKKITLVRFFQNFFDVRHKALQTTSEDDFDADALDARVLDQMPGSKVSYATPWLYHQPSSASLIRDLPDQDLASSSDMTYVKQIVSTLPFNVAECSSSASLFLKGYQRDRCQGRLPFCGPIIPDSQLVTSATSSVDSCEASLMRLSTGDVQVALFLHDPIQSTSYRCADATVLFHDDCTRVTSVFPCRSYEGWILRYATIPINHLARAADGDEHRHWIELALCAVSRAAKDEAEDEILKRKKQQ